MSATHGAPTTGAQVYAPAAQAAGGAGGGIGQRLVAGLWRTLLPSACALCGAVQSEVVCAACAEIALQPTPRCPRCASPGDVRGLGLACHACLACVDDDPLDATLTLGDYAGPLDTLVLRLKFGAALPLAEWIAARLADRLCAASDTIPDVLVPVPLSPQRLAARGFNQAWEIARPLSRRLDIRADATLLARRRDTVTQRTLDLPARRANLRDAFAVRHHERLDGLHIGLVDDVMTTGATLREAARVLKAHGASRVTALPALRTP